MRKIFPPALLMCALLLSGSIGDGSIGSGSVGPSSGGAAGGTNASEGFAATFNLPMNNSGSSEVSDSITFPSGNSVTASLFCSGEDADATDWDCDQGGTLTASGTVTGPHLAPFVDGTGAAGGAHGGDYRSTVTLGGDDDVFIVVAFRSDDDSDATVGAFIGNSHSGARFNIFEKAATDGLSVLVSDGTNTASKDFMTGSVSRSTWTVIGFAFDEDAASITDGCRIFNSGYTANDCFVTGGSWPLSGLGSGTIDVGSYGNGSGISQFDGLIGFVGVWKGDLWVGDTTNRSSMLDAYQEVYQRLTGIWPDSSNGTKISSVMTRSSSATIGITDTATDTRTLHNVCHNWIRVESWAGSWGEVDGADATSFAIGEIGSTNLCLQSADLSTTWTTVGSTIDVDQQTDAYGGSTLDDIDGTGSGEHGVSQAITLSAVGHTFSTWWTPGNQTFAYLDVSSIANVSAYFDSTDCQPDTVGSAATALGEVWGPNLCRISISFTGTVASHTARALCAESDGDKDFTGAAGDCAFGMAQMEAQSFSTSYVATTTGTVARAGDTLRWPSAGNAPLGSVTIQYDVLFPSVANENHYWVGVNDSTSNNRILVFPSSSGVTAWSNSGGPNQGSLACADDVTDGAAHTIRVTHADDDFNMYIDADTAPCSTDTSAPTPAAQTNIDVLTANDTQYISNVLFYNSVVSP